MHTPTISFEQLYLQSKTPQALENPANNVSIEISMGVDCFSVLRGGVHSFVQQCFRTMRTHLQEQMQLISITRFGNSKRYHGVCIILNVR